MSQSADTTADAAELVRQGRDAISNGADDLETAFLLHPRWTQIEAFRNRAIALRDDITAWLQGAPG